MNVWVLIRQDRDEPAVWLADGLLRFGIAPLVVITASRLTGDTQFIHEVGSREARLVMRFSDGTTVDSRFVRGGICTLGWARLRHLTRFVEDDQDYVAAEHWAFLVSALRSLPGLVNPPGPLGLAGPEFDHLGWRCRAATAGLPVGDGCSPSESRKIFHLVVLDNATFGPQVPPDIAECCIALRAASGSRLLTIDLAKSKSRWEFLSASPRGDLRPGGDALLAAISKTIQ
jgi:hypothetical protein